MTHVTWHMTHDNWHVNLTCDTLYVTPDMWHWHIGYSEYYVKLQVSSSYSLGQVKKWHVTPDMWNVTHVRWFSKCIIYTLANIKLFGYSQCVQSSVYILNFLLKVDLHCNFPHFRNVSNTSDGNIKPFVWGSF